MCLLSRRVTVARLGIVTMHNDRRENMYGLSNFESGYELSFYLFLLPLVFFLLGYALCEFFFRTWLPYHPCRLPGFVRFGEGRIHGHAFHLQWSKWVMEFHAFILGRLPRGLDCRACGLQGSYLQPYEAFFVVVRLCVASHQGQNAYTSLSCWGLGLGPGHSFPTSSQCWGLYRGCHMGLWVFLSRAWSEHIFLYISVIIGLGESFHLKGPLSFYQYFI